MSLNARIERLEASDALQSEPRTFDELVRWDEAGRTFEITPTSRWWPIWQAASEGGDSDVFSD